MRFARGDKAPARRALMPFPVLRAFSVRSVLFWLADDRVPGTVGKRARAVAQPKFDCV